MNRRLRVAIHSSNLTGDHRLMEASLAYPGDVAAAVSRAKAQSLSRRIENCSAVVVV
jgi:hypothetical protein